MNLIKKQLKKKKIDWIIFDYETVLSRKNGWSADIDILYLELCEKYMDGVGKNFLRLLLTS